MVNFQNVIKLKVDKNQQKVYQLIYYDLIAFYFYQNISQFSQTCLQKGSKIKKINLNLLSIEKNHSDPLQRENSQMNIIYFMWLYVSIGVFILFTSLNSIYYLAILGLGTSSVISQGVITYFTADVLVPKVAALMLGKKIFGYDINKKGSPMGQKQIPQCVGLGSAVAFIIVAMLASLLIKWWQGYNNLGQQYEEIHLAYLVTILGTILLGFVDDMLDLQWRYKLIYPFFIVIPMACNYYGPTSVIFTYPINLIIESIDLGPIFFSIYIILLGIYCTNTINIYAGINGLEVGQSIIAAASLLIIFGVKAFRQQDLKQNYYYSIYLLVTFIGSSLALLRKNAYPSQVFIGDTYCYFAGIVLCLAAIIGENGISIHWLLFPQLINFLYSCPQLFGFYPCARHRLAKYDVKTDKIQGQRENMNLLNLSLRILGKENEGQHCKKLMYFQVLTSTIPIIYQIFV